MSLIDYIRSLVFKTVKKNTLLSELTHLDERYIKTTIPITGNLLSALGSIRGNSNELDRIVSTFNRNHIPNTNKSITAVVKTIGKDLEIVSDVVRSLSEVVNKEFDDVTFTGSLNIKQAAILRMIQHIAYIHEYTMSFVEYVIDEEFSHKIKGTKAPKYKKDLIYNGLLDYITLLNVYGRLPGNEFRSWIKKVPDIIVDTKKTTGIMKFAKSPITDNMSLTRNFIGSPMLSIGMYVAELQVEYYNYTVSRKQAIDLKLVRLRASVNSDETNVSLNKQIEYYEEQSRKLSEKIAEQEESISDEQ